MEITPLVPQGVQIIQSYAAGKFRISGTVYDSPVLVFPDRVELWNTGIPPGPDSFSGLMAQSENLDVILVGCGTVMTAMDFALRQDLKQKGLNVEFMDTGAACRTYNVLLTEGRRVAAALLPV